MFFSNYKLFCYSINPNSYNMNTVVEIKTLQDWDSLISQHEKSKEIIVIKYSTRCSLSSAAQNIFDNWFNGLDENQNLLIARVNVLNSYEASAKIEKFTNVRHESPQIIWLKNGKVKWHASHFEINKKSLSSQLDRKI